MNIDLEHLLNNKMSDGYSPSSIYDKNVRTRNYEYESVAEELAKRQKEINDINLQNYQVRERQEIARMEEMRIQRELDNQRFKNPYSLFQRINESN